MSCMNAIQLFLWPYAERNGIEKRSTSGAHINLNEYAKVNHAKKPI